MGGGLLQLVAYGAQDVYLTSSPQVTFFKIVYRRYTNFALESIHQTTNGSTGWGKKISCTISRNGDLITDVFLEIVLKSSGPTFFPAEDLIDDIELEIGGQRIDKHYSDWFRLYDNLFRKDADRQNYRRMTDFVDNEVAGTIKRFYLPLIFFFNKSPGLALPLISLQYHEVKLNISLASSISGIDAAYTPQLDIWVDYVYLDNDERRRYAQISHEFLIEQLQWTGSETVTVDASSQKSSNYRLNFNHPVKALAFAIADPNYHGRYSAYPAADLANLNSYAEGLAPLYSAKLQLNGNDRFSERYGSYFNVVQPWQGFRTRAPAGSYLYSFALRPEGHQPSGTCNFSRVDNATLSLTFKQAANTYGSGASFAFAAANVGSEATTVSGATALNTLRVYAINYNVLRIMSGMGGLAYAT